MHMDNKNNNITEEDVTSQTGVLPPTYMDPLRSWVVSEGMMVSESIVAQSIVAMGGGRGVIATQAIPAGKLIVSVPSKLMLTTRVARQYLSKVQPLPRREAVQELTAVEAIASYLLLAEQDPKTPLYPWIRSLPRQYDNLLELPYLSAAGDVAFPLGSTPQSATEVAEYDGRLPQGEVSNHLELRTQRYDRSIEPYVWSPRLRAKCVEERLRFELSAKRCLDCFPQLGRASATHAALESSQNEDEGKGNDQDSVGGCSGGGIMTLSKMLWAYNSLMSRGFAYDEDIWAMMPWADYFNYDLFPNVTMSFQPKRNRYEFVTTRAVVPGEQLMLQYGKYSDFELALWYGFSLRSALFPSFAPRRMTLSSSSSSSAAPGEKNDYDVTKKDDLHEVAKLNTHCAYVFSPTYDPNGDLPVGLVWAAHLAAQAELHYPPSWKEDDAAAAACGQGDARSLLLDVRIGWGNISEGMRCLLTTLIDCNPPLSSEEVLQRLAASELNALKPFANIASQSQSKGDVTSAGHSQSAMKMALEMSQDHMTLLERYAALPLPDLRRFIDS